ncbi:MAG TPA: IS200/IS605 family transposase [Bacteroidales bacterium]|nr:IS200/IS605 family transposase [Bacteroidales bacterium]
MKPGTFTQIYVQLVFAVKYRETALRREIRPHVFKYMSGILTNQKHKSIIINGLSNHVHILLGLNPSISIADTVHEVKRSSTLFINGEKLCNCKFSWQEGYGAFSYSRSQLANIYKYIEDQEKEHRLKTFREEYIHYLKKREMEFDEQFLYEFWENPV